MKQPKKYWFKAKRYGYGWYPSTWQGWTVLAIYLAFIFYRGFADKQIFVHKSIFAVHYSVEVIVATVILLVICYLKGEKARWRWGN